MTTFYRFALATLFVGLFACEAPQQEAFDIPYAEYDYSEFPFYDLPMGEHKVGFHQEMQWDESRSFNGMEKRPLLVGLWYPADLKEESKQLNYFDYLYADFAHDGETTTDSTHATVESNFIGFADQSFGAEAGDARMAMNSPVRAFSNVKMKDGKHPLLLYAASFNAGIHENSPMWEFLASHGYVIAAIASVGADSPPMTPDTTGIVAQVTDFEMLYEHMVQQPYVDTNMIATAGFSWGGFPTTITGIKKQVDLMISLDGSQTYFPNAVQYFADVYNRPAKGAYVQLSQRGRENPQIKLDTTVYHQMGESADTYLFRFNDLDHRDFGASFHYLNAIANDSLFNASQVNSYGSANSMAVKGAGFVKISEIILQSLNAYLRDDRQAKVALVNQESPSFAWNLKHLKK